MASEWELEDGTRFTATRFTATPVSGVKCDDCEEAATEELRCEFLRDGERGSWDAIVCASCSARLAIPGRPEDAAANPTQPFAVTDAERLRLRRLIAAGTEYAIVVETADWFDERATASVALMAAALDALPRLLDALDARDATAPAPAGDGAARQHYYEIAVDAVNEAIGDLGCEHPIRTAANACYWTVIAELQREFLGEAEPHSAERAREGWAAMRRLLLPAPPAPAPAGDGWRETAKETPAEGVWANVWNARDNEVIMARRSGETWEYCDDKMDALGAETHWRPLPAPPCADAGRETERLGGAS